MKVRVRTNFDTTNALGGEEIELEENGTLRSLLNNISQKIRFSIIDPRSDDVDFAVELKVNGQDYFVLPHQLDSRLADGDEVEILMMMFGGG